MTLDLDPACLQIIHDYPRHRQAEVLLTSRMGPLPPSVRFYPGVAGMAYLAFVAYQLGRHRVLKDRPGYEAVQMLGHRLRSAATRSATLEDYGAELLGSVGARWDDARMEDRLWWREFADTMTPYQRQLLQPKSLTKVATASELLREWLYAVSDYTKAQEAATTTA